MNTTLRAGEDFDGAFFDGAPLAHATIRLDDGTLGYVLVEHQSARTYIHADIYCPDACWNRLDLSAGERERAWTALEASGKLAALEQDQDYENAMAREVTADQEG